MKHWLLQGRKLLVIFDPWVQQIFLKEASENFESTTIFALLIENHLRWKFHKSSSSRSREILETGERLP